MTKKALNRLTPGLYRIFWKKGKAPSEKTVSFGAVGRNFDWSRWIVSTDDDNRYSHGAWEDIQKVELLFSNDQVLLGDVFKEKKP